MTKELEAVRRAAEVARRVEVAARESRAALAVAIRAASKAGATLGEISIASGLTRQRVHQLVREA